MPYTRTQIYLDPEDHRRLREEAHARGISLAALLRELARAHVREGAAEYGSGKAWDAIIAISVDDEPSDIARFEADYKRRAWESKARAMERQIAGARRSARKKPRAR